MSTEAIVPVRQEQPSGFMKFLLRITRPFRPLTKLEQAQKIIDTAINPPRVVDSKAMAAALDTGARPKYNLLHFINGPGNDDLVRDLFRHLDFNDNDTATSNTLPALSDNGLFKDICAALSPHTMQAVMGHLSASYGGGNTLPFRAFRHILRLGYSPSEKIVGNINSVNGESYSYIRPYQQLLSDINRHKKDGQPDQAWLNSCNLLAPAADLQRLIVTQYCIEELVRPYRSLLVLPQDVQDEIDGMLHDAAAARSRTRAIDSLGRETEFQFKRPALNNSGREITVVVTAGKMLEAGPARQDPVEYVTTFENDHQFLWSREDKEWFEAKQRRLTALTDKFRLAAELPQEQQEKVDAEINDFDPDSFMLRVRIYDTDGAPVMDPPFVRNIITDDKKAATAPLELSEDGHFDRRLRVAFDKKDMNPPSIEVDTTPAERESRPPQTQKSSI